MALTLGQIKAHMVPYEGEVPHLYLDTVGRVTVGIGNMLPDLAAAQALPFVRKQSQEPASPDEIRADWLRVVNQPGGRLAAYYEQHTKLELTAFEIDALYQRRVDEFQTLLRGVFTNFDCYPESAQLAVLDMAFNLGVGALRNNWPKFKAAVLAENWIDASVHCRRPSARPHRNDGTSGLFQAAASYAAISVRPPTEASG